MRLLALLRRTVGQARYILVGSFTFLWALQLVIVGQAAAIANQNSFERMAELVPAFLQRGMGSRAMLLATFKGTVAFGYFHPVIVLVIVVVAIYLSTEPAHEVEAGLVDLEVARSLPRHMLITRSLVSAAAAVMTAAVLMGFGTWLGLRIFSSPSHGAPSWWTFVILLLHAAGVAAVFAGLGAAIAAGARRWSTAFFTTVLVAVVLYLLDFLSIGWPIMRTVTWISPFAYYPALSIVAGDAPAARNLVVLYSSAAVLCAIGYWRFERRDL